MASAIKYPGGKRWNVTLFADPSEPVGSGTPEGDPFAGRPEFSVSNRYPGNLTLADLQALVLHAQNAGNALLMLCNTNHCFSQHYTAACLEAGIAAAEQYHADILLGAVNRMDSAIQIDQHLFWLDGFRGLRFVVLFRRFYDTLLHSSENRDTIITDQLLGNIAANKLLLYPFISNVSEKISKQHPLPGSAPFYTDPAEQLSLLQQVKTYYSSIQADY